MTTWVCRYQKGKTSLDLNEARDNGLLQLTGINLAILKQSAPHFRYLSPHQHLIIQFFTGQMLFLMPNCVKAPKALS